MGFKVGQVEFVVEHRNVGTEGDGGATLRVCSEIDGKRLELLRFDCFRIGPHFHYAPYGKDERWNLDPLTTGDTIEWTRDQIRNRLPEMLVQAGHEALAKTVDRNAVSLAIPRIEAAMRSGEEII